ncbi:MAG: 3-hydroxyacyl-ACP dehydratase FabZ family protein [Gemmatimonadales bacterium]
MIEQADALTAPSLIDIDSTFLPLAHMRQIARVTGMDGGSITGEMDVGTEHWVYPQHFPGDPIFPGTLLIEAAGQLVALWAWAQGQRGRPRLVRTSAEFHRPAGPTTRHILLRAEVRRKRHLHFGTIHVSAADVQLAIVEAVLAVLPPIQ